MRAVGLAGAAAALALVSGCGSTVANGVAAGSDATSADGLSVQQPAASFTAVQPPDSSGSASLGTTAVRATGAGGLSPSHINGHAPANPAGVSALPTSTGIEGPGVTATTITIGVSYYQSAEAANAAFGAKGLSLGDPVAGMHVLVNWINKHGGVAGRKLVPLLYGVDPQSATPYATEAQSECAFFTEDHKVLAVIDGTPALQAQACLGQHGVADLRGPMVTSTLAPNEIDVYTARLDRVFTALTPALMSAGWFGGWNRLTARPGPLHAKTGIVTPDSNDDNRIIDHVLIPALRAAGHAPDSADVIRIAEPGGFSDDGATVAAIDNAVLKLNADGVTHVILNDGNGSLSLLFNNYAYSQGYFPRYGGTSGNAWQVLLTAGDLQAKTLHGAMGIGWQPVMDAAYGRTDGDGAFPNAARRHCFDVFRRGGMPHTDAATAGGDAEGCDVAFLLPAVFRGYTGPVNISALLSRVNALRSSYPLASGFASRFAPDQHDGNGAYATFGFADGCGCIQYTGPPRPMPR